MIFELMDGSLDDLLRTGSYATGPRPISLDQLTRLVLEHVLSGLEYLHANGIVHRDIKPGNILYSCRNGVYRFCIGDFGSSNYATMARTNDVGTLIFMAPEIKRSGQLQSAKADIWSLFVTVLWIINHRQIRQSTVRCMSPEDISASTTSLADDLRVLGDMASIDPDQRPSAVELLHRIAGRHDPLSDRPHEDNGQNIALAGYSITAQVSVSANDAQ
ncbi:hypothetical protein SCUCBS95973_001023 [Sporothrix curviconia]|uniref:non-specific serine/threonine protein kinase n=1 Tax=Sporothrix curviconia TaxID=1260050 RepID=A0ABP0AV25_9PEZI